jgi:hypothetical protein
VCVADLLGSNRFCFLWCGLRYGFSDLQVPSLAMVPTLSLERRLPLVYYNKLYYDRQALSGSENGVVRMAARLRLMLVSIVVNRWSKDLLVILCTTMDDHQ